MSYLALEGKACYAQCKPQRYLTASKIDNITLTLIGLRSNEAPVKTTQHI